MAWSREMLREEVAVADITWDGKGVAVVFSNECEGLH